jgi:putative inorganic carbon (HCO3(-)) transporter
MSFAFFIALNAVLLIRPEELLPDIAGARLYLIIMGFCLLTAGPRVWAQLAPAQLVRRPITLCVLGLFVAVALSHLARGQFTRAFDEASEFGKVVVYYLLLVAVVDTPGRLRTFLGWLVVFVIVLATLGLLQYHEVIDIEALRPVEQKEFDPETGDLLSYPRLCSSGIYNDPNDLCLILVTGSLCCLYRAASARGWLTAIMWLAPIGLFGYAVMLTQSRGGFLGLAVAALAWLYARYGWKRTAPLALVLLPALALVFAGRQTTFELGAGDTAQERIRLWSEGFSELLRTNPLTGIGAGEYAEVCDQVAHNSFVHGYVELGLIGGGLFLCAFYLAVSGLHAVRRSPAVTKRRGLAQLQPYVFAMVVGYAAGAFSLSRNYIVPTYLILGLATAFLGMAQWSATRSGRLDGRLVRHLALVAVGGIVFLKLLTQAFAQFGG